MIKDDRSDIPLSPRAVAVTFCCFYRTELLTILFGTLYPAAAGQIVSVPLNPRPQVAPGLPGPETVRRRRASTADSVEEPAPQ